MGPTLYRPTNGRLQLSLPFQLDNRGWLRELLGSGIHLDWVKAPSGGHWSIARDHLMPLLQGLVAHYGRVYVRLEFKASMRCDSRCRDAKGDDCVCSCLGSNHGGAAGRTWFEVGDTTLISSDTRVITGWATTATLRRAGWA